MAAALPPELIDQIVSATFESYAALSFRPQPNKFTILASFTLIRHTVDSDTDQPRVQVISLGTGSKCLPENRLPPSGDALHDSHAEVLARRGAVRWLAQEIIRDNGGMPSDRPEADVERKGLYQSPWICRGCGGKYHLKNGVKPYLYISTVPCKAQTLIEHRYSFLTLLSGLSTSEGGDASTRLLASLQDPTMASLKGATSWPVLSSDTPSRGRDDYSRLGVLRTKPGRADAPAVLSMTCSDKIARWNVLGIQGTLMSSFLEPVYVEGVVIGEVAEEMRGVVREDCRRALYGRLGTLDGKASLDRNWLCSMLTCLCRPPREPSNLST